MRAFMSLLRAEAGRRTLAADEEVEIEALDTFGLRRNVIDETLSAHSDDGGRAGATALARC